MQIKQLELRYQKLIMVKVNDCSTENEVIV